MRTRAIRSTSERSYWVWGSRSAAGRFGLSVYSRMSIKPTVERFPCLCLASLLTGLMESTRMPRSLSAGFGEADLDSTSRFICVIASIGPRWALRSSTYCLRPRCFSETDAFQENANTCDPGPGELEFVLWSKLAREGSLSAAEAG